jgi:hypothetical protein
MSSLFLDTNVDMVELVLNKKDGSGTTAFYIGLDYYAPYAAYSTQTVTIYPILVSPPALSRNVGVNASTREDVSFDIYAKTHFQSYGVGFSDLLQTYELVGSKTNFYYYTRSRDLPVAPVTENLRLKTEIIGYSTDDVSGVMTIQTREVWWKNKELGKKIRGDVFADMDADWDGEYGAYAFGALSSGNGIVIDAPVIQSGIVSNTPTALLFTGWTEADHPNDSKKAIFVRTQEKRETSAEWVQLTMETDPETYYHGNDSIASIDYFAARYRSLSHQSAMARLQLNPSTEPARILTAVRVGVSPITTAWSVRFDGSSDWVLGIGPADDFQPNESEDSSFTIAGWVYLVSTGTTQTIACTQAGTGTNMRSWKLFYDTSVARFRVVTYQSSGSNLDLLSASTFGAPSTGVWYYVQARLDGTANTLEIRVNNGAWDSMATTGDPAQSKAGIRFGAARSGSALVEKLSGNLQAWNFFDDAVSNTILNHLYNSGNGRLSVDISDAYRENLVASWDFDDILEKKVKDKHGNHDLNIVGAPYADVGKIPVTVTQDDGELSLKIFFTQYNSLTALYEPVGNALREMKVDINDSGIQAGSTKPFFQVSPPLLCLAGENYGFVLEWSNHSNHSKALLFNDEAWTSRTDVMDLYLRNEYGETDRGWKATTGPAREMELACYWVGEGSTTWDAGDSDPYYSSSQQSLEAKSITLTSGQAHLEFANDFEFKVGLEGLVDNPAGDYTGTGSATMGSPASILQWLLQHSSCLNLPDAQLDLPSFSGLRLSLYPVGFSVDRSISIEELIIQLCRQSRTIIYRKRNGEIALRYPTYTGAAWGTKLNEAELRADLTLLGYADDNDSNLVNEFKFPYAIDNLNQPKDPALLRRAETDKYSGYMYIDANDATNNDQRRIALCAASQALYGKREMAEPLDMYDSATPVELVQNYYCDRYSLKQQRGVFRIPRNRYYSTVDLFSTIQAQHSGLPFTQGTGFDNRSYFNDSGAIWYFEGVRSLIWSGGTIAGEVVGITEEGPFMTITVETMSPF